MSAHYVYRIFDQDGRLIYVGSTKNLIARLRVHQQSWFGYQCAKAVANVYQDRVAALEAEREAIKSEQPRWNIKCAWANHPMWTREQFHDYLLATAHTPIITEATRTHIANVEKIYRARFGLTVVVA
jgi:excinuclease UvrABC nuclease subunit